MLMTLPIVLALGFCVGTLVHLLYHGESHRLKRTILELPRGTLSVLAFTLIVMIFVLGTRLSVYRLTMYGGDAAGFVVGGLAGHWFFASESVAYRGAFIAGCAAALFLAALDYDHDLFQNLTKFNAAGVGVEFSEQRAERSTDKWQRALSLVASERQESPFPGAQALDFAISGLDQLSVSATNDEKYALLLAGSDPSNVKRLGDIGGSARSFAIYAQSVIVPLAKQLETLQAFHRSETSLLSVDSSLIAALRRTYLRAGAGEDSAELDDGLYPERAALNVAFAKIDARLQSRRSTGPRFGLWISDNIRLGQEVVSDLQEEVRSYWSLRGGGASSISEDFLRVEVVIARETNAVELAQSRNAKADDQRPSPCAHLAHETEADESDSIVCSGYLALATAYAEAAIGNSENAMHVLETEIDNERTATKPTNGVTPNCRREAPETDNCGGPAPIRLRLARRIVLLRRLEVTQLLMIALRQSQARDDIFISRAISLVEDADSILRGSEMKSGMRKVDYETSQDGRSAGACESEFVSAPSEKAQLFSRVLVSKLAVESMALSLVASNPHIVPRILAEDPRIVAKLDRYAEDVSRLDFDCAKRLLSNLNWRVPAYFLDSAAGYWTAKGEQFHISANDPALPAALRPDSVAMVKALCEGQKMRSAAIDVFRTMRPRVDLKPRASQSATTEDALDAEAQESIDQSFLLDQRSGLDRIEQDLSAFPGAEKASACGE